MKEMRKMLTVWLELFWKGNDTVALADYTGCHLKYSTEEIRARCARRAIKSSKKKSVVINPVIFPNSIGVGTKSFLVFPNFFRVWIFVLDEDVGISCFLFFGKTDIFNRPKQFLKTVILVHQCWWQKSLTCWGHTLCVNLPVFVDTKKMICRVFFEMMCIWIFIINLWFLTFW